MTFEQSRAKISGAVWQGVAQSGVDLSNLPQDQQDQLVRSISNAVLSGVNELLDEAQPALPVAEVLQTDVDAEEVLWQGRPFLSLSETYIVTNERIKIIRGVLGRDIENFELIRVQDIDFTQTVGERLLNLGDVTIRGSDTSRGMILLRNVSEPEKVYETLRRAWLAARKRHGLQFREEM